MYIRIFTIKTFVKFHENNLKNIEMPKMHAALV